MEIKFKQSDLILNIQKHRREKGYTVKELANYSRMTVGRLSIIINGSYLPSYSELEKLAHVFNISVEELLGHRKKEVQLKEKVLSLVENFLTEKHSEKFRNELMLIMLDKGVI